MLGGGGVFCGLLVTTFSSPAQTQKLFFFFLTGVSASAGHLEFMCLLGLRRLNLRFNTMEFSRVPESAERHHHVMCVCQTDSEWASVNGMVMYGLQCCVLHASKIYECMCFSSMVA